MPQKQKGLNPGLAAAVHKLTIEDRRKGGRNAAPARKRNGDIRRAVQQILNGTYLDGNGNEITGAEAVAIAVFSIAVDTGNRNAISAARLLVDIIGQDKTPEERKKIKAEIAVLEAQCKKITQTASSESNEDIKIILERRGNENEGNSG